MTTATAATEGTTPTPENVEEVDGRTPTANILTDQDGEEAVDSAEVEAAMAEGFRKAGASATSGISRKAKPDADNDGEQDITDVLLKNTSTTGKDDDTVVEDGADPDKTNTPVEPEEDPEIPGLGKVSEMRAKFARLDALEKAVASTSGHLGHLKQLVTAGAGKGKAVTKEALKNVAVEFGEEFADALAKDLSEAGIGSGASVDPAMFEQMVKDNVAVVREEESRKFEKKLVLRVHKDADDHFARPKLDAQGNPVFQKDGAGNDVPVWDRGPKNEAFMAFVGTLPKERQQELANTWDSEVITRALDEFKAHEKKAATQQATQKQRTNRAVAPTSSSGRQVTQPVEDPMLQGWKNVRGRGPSTAGSRR